MIVKVNKKLISKFIEAENSRQYYAGINDYTNLMKLYKSKLPDIKNNNVSNKWDLMNNIAKFDASNPMAEDRTNIVANIIDYNNKKILNIGFGPLNLENKLYNNFNHGIWEGIDISRKSVSKANSKYPNFKFTVGSIINYPLKKASYDIVLALEVLEHISYRDIFAVLRKVNSSLVKNGLFIVSVPLNEKLDEMIYKGANPNAHLRIYSRDLIKAELTISQFKVIKEIQLSAFNKYYYIKKIIKTLIPRIFESNNLILVCQKS